MTGLGRSSAPGLRHGSARSSLMPPWILDREGGVTQEICPVSNVHGVPCVRINYTVCAGVIVLAAKRFPVSWGASTSMCCSVVAEHGDEGPTRGSGAGSARLWPGSRFGQLELSEKEWASRLWRSSVSARKVTGRAPAVLVESECRSKTSDRTSSMAA